MFPGRRIVKSDEARVKLGPSGYGCHPSTGAGTIREIVADPMLGRGPVREDRHIDDDRIVSMKSMRKEGDSTNIGEGAVTRRHWVSTPFSPPAAQDRTCNHRLRLGGRRKNRVARPSAARSKGVFDDRLPSPEAGSPTYGTRDDAAEPALPADDTRTGGEHGTASAAAYHRFEIGKRKYVAVDVPGIRAIHELWRRARRSPTLP